MPREPGPDSAGRAREVGGKGGARDGKVSDEMGRLQQWIDDQRQLCGEQEFTERGAVRRSQFPPAILAASPVSLTMCRPVLARSAR